MIYLLSTGEEEEIIGWAQESLHFTTRETALNDPSRAPPPLQVLAVWVCLWVGVVNPILSRLNDHPTRSSASRVILLINDLIIIPLRIPSSAERVARDIHHHSFML